MVEGRLDNIFVNAVLLNDFLIFLHLYFVLENVLLSIKRVTKLPL